MLKRLISAWLCTLLCLTALGMLCVFDTPISLVDRVAASSTLYVNETGSGGVYTSIQDAINASYDGDSVYVYSGTYYENVVVNKSINLTGEDRDTTIIDSRSGEDALRIVIDWVNISSVTITNSGNSPSYAGIKLENVLNCGVTNNKVLFKNGTGIYLISSINNRIFDNYVSNNENGIFITSYSNNNLIFNNTVSSNNQHGIQISRSSNNKITSNDISSNIYGIYISYSESNLVGNNIMDDNGIVISGDSLIYWNTHSIDATNTVNGKQVVYKKNETGITVSHGEGQIIFANCTNMLLENWEVSASTVGISLGFSPNNRLNNIWADSNGMYGVYLECSTNNVIENATTRLNNISGIYLHYSELNTIKNTEASSNEENGISLAYSSYNTLDSVDAIDNFRTGLGINGRNNTFKRVNSSNNNIGIEVSTYSTNNSFIECDVHSNLGDYSASGISILGAHNKIINSSISNNNHTGISIRTSSANHNIISNSTIFSNHYGIRTWYSAKNTTIIECTVSLNEMFGIVCDTQSVTIDRCNVMYNIEGVFFRNSNNTVKNSDISYNSQSGVTAEQTDDNIVSNCIFISNSCGVALKGSNNIVTDCLFMQHSGSGVFCSANSAGNLIYHNNFCDNSYSNAQDDANNHFDNGYPNGGNYWDDYTGEDLFSGLNQDQLGYDGIGDIPYKPVIHNGGEGEITLCIDNYPLMEPFPDTLPPRIQLISPHNNSFIQSGVSLDFDIYDGNLDFVNYSVDGGLKQLLHSPYNISTTTWTDGSYTITIVATDTRKNSATKSYNFIIDLTPPNADAGPDQEVIQGTSVYFNGSASLDNRGLIISYTWVFNYNDKANTLFDINPNFKFEKVGNFCVTLTVRDPSNNSASDTIWVNVTGIDSDNDGLTDYDEDHIYGTNPNNLDSDNDGINDGDEVAAGTDPLVAEPIDTRFGGKDIFSEYWWLLALIVVLIVGVIMAVLRTKRKKVEPEEDQTDTTIIPTELAESKEDQAIKPPITPPSK